MKHDTIDTPTLGSSCLEILKNYTGLPFEAFIDEHKKMHAILKYRPDEHLKEGEYEVLRRIRFCIKVNDYKEIEENDLDNFDTLSDEYEDNPIHAIYRNSDCREVHKDKTIKFIIPNIDQKECTDQIPDLLNPAQGSHVKKQLCEYPGNADHIIALAGEYKRRNEFFIKEHQQIRQTIQHELKNLQSEHVVLCQLFENNPCEKLLQNSSKKISSKYWAMFHCYKMLEMIDAIYSANSKDSREILDSILSSLNSFILILQGKCLREVEQLGYIKTIFLFFYDISIYFLNLLDAFNFKSSLGRSPLFLTMSLQSVAVLVRQRKLKVEDQVFIDKLISLSEALVKDASSFDEDLPYLIFKSYIYRNQFDPALTWYNKIFVAGRNLQIKKFKFIKIAYCFPELIDFFNIFITLKKLNKEEIKKMIMELKLLVNQRILPAVCNDLKKSPAKSLLIKENVNLVSLFNFLQKLDECLARVDSMPESTEIPVKKKKKHKKKKVMTPLTLLPPKETKSLPGLITNPLPFNPIPLELSKHEPTPRIDQKLIDKNKEEKRKKYLMTKPAVAADDKENIFQLRYQHGMIQAKIAVSLQQKLSPALTLSILSILAKKDAGIKKQQIKPIKEEMRKKYNLPPSITHEMSLKVTDQGLTGKNFSLFATFEKHKSKEILVFTNSSLDNKPIIKPPA